MPETNPATPQLFWHKCGRIRSLFHYHSLWANKLLTGEYGCVFESWQKHGSTSMQNMWRRNYTSCFALPGEGRKSSFTGLHFDAFVGSSNVHQETQILLPFRLRAKSLTDISHSWVPTRTADPDTQHELTQLRSQLAQLAKELGKIQATLPHHNGSFSI